MSSTGFSHMVMKLKDPVVILINNFQEFTTLFKAKEDREGRSFGCMSFILHSIDLVVRSFVYGIDKKWECTSYQGGANVAIWDVSVFSTVSEEIISSFLLLIQGMPKGSYLFGHFSMNIKMVPIVSAGTVTAVYFSSQNAEHDKKDSEFLGNRTG
ncbi:hypothetical protein KIW84_022059 [Lathyrus oleraceus]|uniref:GH16 domain-containing protein n=1 Tax=Pisum sativum TaxID=3888 RepID=A0A9D4YC78_PEA|nr:hypothetical protein KIW84_022058 [Pisum sativum]KAI5435484.1 hypothetical protein KIW84_022059 [Pisum sativum]